MRTALPTFVLLAAKKNEQKHASLHCKSRPLIKSKKHIAKQTAFIGQRGRQPRREKGEDCLSGASSAAPERGVGVRANSPITAAALLGSFFSLLRRMNKKHIAKQNRIYREMRTAHPPFVLRAAEKNGQKHASLHCKSRPLIKSKNHIAKQTAFIGK